MKSEAPWRVGKWAPEECGDLPWYACDRGGWFGRGLPGRSFATHKEAITYATRMSRLLDQQKGRLYEPHAKTSGRNIKAIATASRWIPGGSGAGTVWCTR